MMKKHEVVISGISGRFPQCDTFEEFKEALLCGKPLIQENPKGWKDTIEEERRMGAMNDSIRFDANFFGIPRKVCEVTDLDTRLLLERVFECIIDAGLSPSEVRGSATAVCMCNVTYEWELQNLTEKSHSHVMMARARCMHANRISYAFDFTGPSFTISSSPVVGVQGLETVANLVATGRTRMAVVGVSNIAYTSYSNYHLDEHGLRFLSHDGETRSFSEDADGFWRSEGVVVLLLERAEDARRAYAVVEAVESCSLLDSASHRFLSHPSLEEFIRNFYNVNNIADIGLMIAEGSALPAVDNAELSAFANLVQARQDPLPVTSIKGIVGHGETCSSFFSLLAAITTFQTGRIIPVLKYKQPHKATWTDALKIVTDYDQFNGDRIAINSVGWVNHFGHIVLRRPDYYTIYRPLEDVSNVPALVLLSGRNCSVMNAVLEKMHDGGVDSNYVALLHKAFSRDISRHIYRGFTVLRKNHPVTVKMYDLPEQRPVWLVLSGMGSQWIGMGSALLQVPIIAQSLQRCALALAPQGINLLNIITSSDLDIFDNIVNSFIGIAAIQVALVDILHAVGVKVDGILGHSTGELACGYADNCLTAEQTVLAAYARGRASLDVQTPKGMMAAVGKGYQELKGKVPEGIEIACHNSSTSCTLSGPAELIETYINDLKAQGVFAKLVNVSNIAYHSKYIAPAGPHLIRYLENIIPVPKARSSRWISSSILKEHWHEPLAKLCSKEYFTNNLLSPVYFEETLINVPANAILIEVAPHGLLQAILRRALPNCTHVPLTNRSAPDPAIFLLEALGKAYVNGVNMDLSPIYPPVNFPVPLNTRSLQEVVSWNHSDKWNYAFYLPEKVLTPIKDSCERLTYSNEDREILSTTNDYVIHNSSLIPHSKILADVINMFADNRKVDVSTMRILIEDLQFVEELKFMNKELSCNLSLLLSGHFQVLNGNTTILKGKISDGLLEKSHYFNNTPPTLGETIDLENDEIYDFFKDNDHFFNGPYSSLQKISVSNKGFIGTARLLGKTEYLLEALFSSVVFFSMYKKGYPTKLAKVGTLAIDSSLLSNIGESILYYNAVNNKVYTRGITMVNVVTNKLLSFSADVINLKKRKFIPYNFLSRFQDDDEFYDVCTQFILENSPELKSSSSILSLSIMGSRNTKLNQVLSQHCNVKSKTLSLNELLAVSCSTVDPTVLSYKSNNVPFQIVSLLASSSAHLLLHMKSNSSLPGDLIVVYHHETSDGFILLLRHKISDLSKVKVVKTSSTHQHSSVDSLLMTNHDRPVYVIVDDQAIRELRYLVEVAGLNIRFIYAENTVPDVATSPKLLKHILECGFRVIVIKHGIIGSYRYLPMKEFQPSSPKTLLLDEGYNSDEIHAVSIYNDQHDVEKKFQIFDYSSVINGVKVMGLASFVNGKFQIDPTLQWKVPQGWTLEQAATVPLNYCLAFYAVEYLGKAKQGETVFVTDAQSELGKTSVTVAAAFGCKVIVCIHPAHHYSQFVQQFPQLADYVVTKESDVMVLTKGRGIDIAIVTGGSVHRALDLLTEDAPRGFGGRLIQIDPLPMLEDHSFGMEVFIKKASIVGLPSESLLAIGTNEKKWLYNRLNEAFATRIVKPASATIIQSDSLSSAFSKTLSTGSVGMVVVCSNKNSAKEVTNKKTAFIVGNHRVLWFNIIGLLASHGVYNFHLVVDKSFVSPFLLGRIDNFLHSRPLIDIEFHPTKSLQSEEGRNYLIRKLEGCNVQNVTYITSEDDAVTEGLGILLQKRLPQSFVTIIGQRADSVKEQLGVDGIALLCHPRSAICRVLAALDLCHPSSSVVALHEPFKGSSKEVEGALPINQTSLMELEKVTSTKVKLVPLLTQGVSTVQDAMPIVILPGLRVGDLIKLGHRLLYPAHLAVFPAEVNSLSELAEEIAHEIEKEWPELKVATILCEGWSGALSLWVTHHLELCGYQVVVLAIDAAPAVILQHFQDITPLQILCKYFPIDHKKFEELTSQNLWSEQLETAAKGASADLKEFTKALASRMALISQFSHTDFVLDAKVILVRPTSTDKFDHCGLELICKREVKLLQVPEEELFGSACLDALQSYILYQLDDVRPGKRDIESMTAYIDHNQILRNVDQSVTQKQ